MKLCKNKNGDWRTYAAVVWEFDYPYDRQQWYSTWLSARDARDVAYDGLKVLGDGEEVIDSLDGNGCMGFRPFYEMSFRGHENKFIGLYIEDPNCGETENVMPAFVKCSGPGAIIPEDGASCTCGDNSQWNSDTSECECLPNHLGSTHVFWRRNPICTLCSGVGAYNDYYGTCKCGDGATLNDQGVCECNAGLVVEPDGQYCYDGIDSLFDDKQYNCGVDDPDILEHLGYDFGLDNPERLSVDCDTFGYPVIQVDTIGGKVQGPASGIQAEMRPPRWRQAVNPIRSATIVYDVYYAPDHEFIKNEYLPGLFLNDPNGGSAQSRAVIHMSDQELKLQDSKCNYCGQVNDNGILGTMTSGEWHTIEMRIKLNDAGESNGEFMFFFDGELTNHLTDIADMVADDDYEFTHARWWVLNRSPGATNDQSIYFKNYHVSLFSSDTTPDIYTTAAPTEPTTTTHPITTSAPG